MRISMSSLGNFIPSKFSLTPVIANEFIPLIAMNSMNSITNKGDNLQYYSKPSFEHIIRKPNTLKNIKDGFEMGGTTRRIEINGRVFFIAKGVFFSEAGVPLMVCAMKKEAFLDVSVFRFSDYNSDTFSYNNYVLFYSTSFYTDPGLMPLNRRLQKEILQACFEKGIEVRTVTSLEIEKNTFARLFEVKKTKSLTQLEAYMNQVLPNFLHNEGEDTFVEQEFEPVVIHREELSVEDEALLFDNQPTIENLIVPVAVEPNRQLTLEEVIEMAELEAEAAQFDVPSESSDNEDYGDEFHWGDEQDEDEEEMQRHEEAAHTVSIDSQTYFNSQLSMPAPQTAQSLVERVRPLQEAYNMQMLQAQQRADFPTYVAGIDPYTSDINSVQVGQVTWRTARREGQIELIDDTE